MECSLWKKSPTNSLVVKQGGKGFSYKTTKRVYFTNLSLSETGWSVLLLSICRGKGSHIDKLLVLVNRSSRMTSRTLNLSGSRIRFFTSDPVPYYLCKPLRSSLDPTQRNKFVHAQIEPVPKNLVTLEPLGQHGSSIAQHQGFRRLTNRTHFVVVDSLVGLVDGYLRTVRDVFP